MAKYGRTCRPSIVGRLQSSVHLLAAKLSLKQTDWAGYRHNSFSKNYFLMFINHIRWRRFITLFVLLAKYLQPRNFCLYILMRKIVILSAMYSMSTALIISTYKSCSKLVLYRYFTLLFNDDVKLISNYLFHCKSSSLKEEFGRGFYT